ncbi:hypothetical protein HDU83_003537 [Entophlyctis luteolus]|nr:hypothetical protein HDU83_003537 [Entophlyctis luteolus]
MNPPIDASPLSSDAEDDADNLPGSSSRQELPVKAAGRPRSTEEPPNRRIAQSRAKQRAFRERRALYVRGLEEKVEDLTQAKTAFGALEDKFKSELENLQSEIASLRMSTEILRSLKDSLQAENDQIKAKYTRLRDESTELQTAKESLSLEVERLKAISSFWESETNKLRNMLVQYHHYNQRIWGVPNMPNKPYFGGCSESVSFRHDEFESSSGAQSEGFGHNSDDEHAIFESAVEKLGILDDTALRRGVSRENLGIVAAGSNVDGTPHPLFLELVRDIEQISSLSSHKDILNELFVAMKPVYDEKEMLNSLTEVFTFMQDRRDIRNRMFAAANKCLALCTRRDARTFMEVVNRHKVAHFRYLEEKFRAQERWGWVDLIRLMASSSLPPPPLPGPARAASAALASTDPARVESAGSALFGSAASASSAGPGEKPRSKVGRKLASDEPANKRLAQSREASPSSACFICEIYADYAQRAFRERRANHVRDLESKVSELTKIVESRGPSPMELQLQQKVRALEAENSLLRQQMSFGFDFVKQPTILPAVDSLYTGPLSLVSGFPFATFATPSPLVAQNPLLGIKPSVQSFLGGATATGSSSGILNNELALHPFGLQMGSDGILANVMNNNQTPTEGSSEVDDLFSHLRREQYSPDGVPTVVLQSASDSKSDDASLRSRPLLSSASDPDLSTLADFHTFRDSVQFGPDPSQKTDFELLQSLLEDFENVPTPPKSIKDMTVMEKCALISEKSPFFAEAYLEIQKIPSLASHDELVDVLCESFIELKCSQRPVDATRDPQREVEEIHAKVLDVCTPEDAEKFNDLMLEKRMKHCEYMKKLGGT